MYESLPSMEKWRHRIQSAFASEHSAAHALRTCALILFGSGLPLILLAGASGLQILGSTLAAGGIACLLTGIGLRLTASARTRERIRGTTESSAALASRLYESQDHAEQFFGETFLRHKVTLRGHCFRGAVFDHADWGNAILDRCDFRAASFISASLTECTAAEGDFRYSKFDGCEIWALAPGSSFRGAQCGSANFRHCLLDHSSFASLPAMTTYLRRANFADSSTLDDVDFGRVNAEDACFTKTTLYGTRFDDAFLANASFERADMYGVSFRGAMLAGFAGDRPARFDEADFESGLPSEQFATDLSEAWLIGVDLSGVKSLESAALSGAMANKNTKFPAGFDATASGVCMLHQMPKEEALATFETWKQDHARPAGWLS